MGRQPLLVFGHPQFAGDVHGAFPKLFEVLPRLQDSLNDLTARAYPNPETYQRVILNLGILVGISVWELVTLAGNGFGQGAMKIARTVMETAINAEYLRLFPNECDLYLNWHWVEQYKLLTYLRHHSPQLIQQLSAEEVERVENEYRTVRVRFEKPNGDLRASWCSLNLGERAARTGFAEAYRVINPISSQFIHGTCGGLANHFDLSKDENRVSIPPSLDYVGQALIGAHMCTVKTVETIAAAFRWAPRIPVPELSKDFHYAWE